MPIDAKHPEYTKYAPMWKKSRIVMEGEEAVKSAGTEFLPRLSEQTSEEYAAYRERALFFAAAGRTREALVGSIFAVTPVYTFPTSQESILKQVTRDGRSIETFSVKVVEELFTTGRYGVLCDTDKSGVRPFLAGYAAECIYNWRTKMVNGVEVLTMVVLEEESFEPKDEFDTEPSCKLRYLFLDPQTGAYTVRLYKKASKSEQSATKSEWVPEGEDVNPTLRGQKISVIPFTFYGVRDLSSCPHRPPMQDVVNVNISHYRTSADLEHGRHYTALPTPWAAGFDKKSSLYLGSSKAWVSEDPGASCGFLEFQGQGLGALENGLKEKQHMMAVLGSRLLEGDKNAVEAADTMRVKRASERSVLAQVANNVGEGLRTSLEYLRDWAGAAGDVDAEFNDDFDESSLTPEMLAQLMAQVQAGMLSWKTYFYNVKRGNLLPDDRTEEDEQGLIEMGMPISPTSTLGLDIMDRAAMAQQQEGAVDPNAQA